MIKTLADLNTAGKKLWAKDFHPATKNNAPPGMEKCPNCGGYGRKYGEVCDVCHGKGFIPEGSADKAKDFTTNPAEIEAAAKKAKAAGKSKEDFVAGYSGGAAETATRAWGKDSGIKTLADLNKAGRRFWSGDAGEPDEGPEARKIRTEMAKVRSDKSLSEGQKNYRLANLEKELRQANKDL